jgi:hypothetical protein
MQERSWLSQRKENLTNSGQVLDIKRDFQLPTHSVDNYVQNLRSAAPSA